MMKKLFIIMAMLFIISSVDAKIFKRSLIEIGPKANLYIKNEDVQFGIGVEVVVNPLRSVGFRFNLTEIRFDPTTFYFNREGSIDAFVWYTNTLFNSRRVGFKLPIKSTNDSFC
jgi:hypothetical protein